MSASQDGVCFRHSTRPRPPFVLFPDGKPRVVETNPAQDSDGAACGRVAGRNSRQGCFRPLPPFLDASSQLEERGATRLHGPERRMSSLVVGPDHLAGCRIKCHVHPWPPSAAQAETAGPLLPAEKRGLFPTVPLALPL